MKNCKLESDEYVINFNFIRINNPGESFGLKFNPSESEIFRAIPNHFETIRKTFWISFDANRLSNSRRFLSELTQIKYSIRILGLIPNDSDWCPRWNRIGSQPIGITIDSKRFSDSFKNIFQNDLNFFPKLSLLFTRTFYTIFLANTHSH